jgi:hypothetical protein
MSRSQWIASLWPGFTRAWVFGKWEGVLLAGLFTAALNTALLVTFGAHEITHNIALVGSAWVLVVGFWAVGIWWRAHDLSRLRITNQNTANRNDSLLIEAQQNYLKGHWIEAESIVVQVLAQDSADIEARLLLASVQRRTLRTAEAQRTLLELQSHPAASKWQLEIESELAQLSDANLPPKAA